MYYCRDCFWGSLSESTQFRGSIRHLLIEIHGFQCNPGIGGGVEQKNDAPDMVYILGAYTTGSVYILGGALQQNPKQTKQIRTNVCTLGPVYTMRVHTLGSVYTLMVHNLGSVCTRVV